MKREKGKTNIEMEKCDKLDSTSTCSLSLSLLLPCLSFFLSPLWHPGHPHSSVEMKMPQDFFTKCLSSFSLSVWQPLFRSLSTNLLLSRIQRKLHAMKEHVLCSQKFLFQMEEEEKWWRERDEFDAEFCFTMKDGFLSFFFSIPPNLSHLPPSPSSNILSFSSLFPFSSFSLFFIRSLSFRPFSSWKKMTCLSPPPFWWERNDDDPYLILQVLFSSLPAHPCNNSIRKYNVRDIIAKRSLLTCKINFFLVVLYSSSFSFSSFF